MKNQKMTKQTRLGIFPLERDLNAFETDPLTQVINRGADEVDTRSDPVLERLQNRTLERHG